MQSKSGYGPLPRKRHRMSKPNLVASIRQRLLNKAKANGEAFDYVLARYGTERLLYRLANSSHSNSFVLKGAMLFYVWNRQMHRPTRDVDLLGFGSDDLEIVTETFSEIARITTPEDGLSFDAGSIKANSIREQASYQGIRIKMLTPLGNVRIPIQIDIGFGDAITPSTV